MSFEYEKSTLEVFVPTAVHPKKVIAAVRMSELPFVLLLLDG